jgi:Eukaryotic aspartyl protease
MLKVQTYVHPQIGSFGLALTGSSWQFSGNDIPFDGLMGVARSTLSNQGVLTPIESLAVASAIPSAITSFKLSRVADGTNDGQVTIGGLDSSWNQTYLANVH